MARRIPDPRDFLLFYWQTRAPIVIAVVGGLMLLRESFSWCVWLVTLAFTTGMSIVAVATLYLRRLRTERVRSLRREGWSMAESPRRRYRGNLPGVRRILTADHEIPDRSPIVLRAGEGVEVGARDTEWPAFVFVVTEHGSGWVPARHLQIHGASGVVRVPYDTRELPASQGEVVDLLRGDPESGWSWCRNAEGREGWVPDRVLVPLG